jgi:hypothetical protein
MVTLERVEVHVEVHMVVYVEDVDVENWLLGLPC